MYNEFIYTCMEYGLIILGDMQFNKQQHVFSNLYPSENKLSEILAEHRHDTDHSSIWKYVFVSTGAAHLYRLKFH